MGLSTLIFIVCNFLGLAIALISNSFFGVWCGLELGFFGLVPLLIGKGSQEAEAGFNYFLIQVIGSGFLVVGLVELVTDSFIWSLWFFILVGLSMKMGLFPFHMWVPSVVSFSGWAPLCIILIVQNLGPFWVLSGLGVPVCTFYVFIFFGVMTSVSGCLGGLNQVGLRPILGYSSLSHTGWMIFLSFVDWSCFFLYFVVYAFLLVGLIILCTGYKQGLSLPISCYLLSMGGLPPFLGSVSKIIGISCMVGWSTLILSSLVFCSMVSLGYYSWLFISLNLTETGGSGYSGLSHIVLNLGSGVAVLVGLFLMW